MQVHWGSLEHQVLEMLCGMPLAVRGMSDVMLDRAAPGAARILHDMAADGLLKSRGWCEGPGLIWVPTAAGEAALGSMATEGREPLA